MSDIRSKEHVNGLCYRCVFRKATREIGSGPMSRWLCDECYSIESSSPAPPSSKQRFEFESWAASNGFPTNRYPLEPETYSAPSTHCAWITWQHCMAIRPVKTQPAASNLESLRAAGETGADLSPGDPLCKWAYDEIERLTHESKWGHHWHRLVESIATILEVNSAGGFAELAFDIPKAIERLRAMRQVETFELRTVPSAWMRGIPPVSTPDGPGEWEVDFSYGDDQPEGDGWVPLYSKPPHIRPAVEPEPPHTERQCSWGCHYAGDQFIRYAACTVHGASQVKASAPTPGGSVYRVCCAKCQAEVNLTASDGRINLHQAGATGWYFSTETGWLCPTDAP